MVESMNYSVLQSNELLTFGQRMIGIFGSNGQNNDENKLWPFVFKLSVAYSDYSKAFEREQKNPYTIELAQTDAERGNAFDGFRNYIEACSHRNAEGWSNAARAIMEIIRKHGWSISHLGYKAETATITNIINELKTKCADNITLLMAEEWMQQLVTAQDAFEQIQRTSVTRTGNNDPTIMATRPVLTKALKALITFINLHYSANSTDTQLAAYVKAIEELAQLTMTSARANVTRQENQKKKEHLPTVKNQT